MKHTYKSHLVYKEVNGKPQLISKINGGFMPLITGAVGSIGAHLISKAISHLLTKQHGEGVYHIRDPKTGRKKKVIDPKGEDIIKPLTSKDLAKAKHSKMTVHNEALYKENAKKNAKA